MHRGKMAEHERRRNARAGARVGSAHHRCRAIAGRIQPGERCVVGAHNDGALIDEQTAERAD